MSSVAGAGGAVLGRRDMGGSNTKWWMAAWLMAVCVTAHASGADPRLREAAQAEQPAVIATLHDLVSIESGSADRAGPGEDR